MTETTTHSFTTFKPSYAPSREELHRTFAGVLYEADFSTNQPSPYNLDRIAKSFRDMEKKRI